MIKHFIQITDCCYSFVPVPATPNKKKPAFYSFLSSDELASTKHHTIPFDVVKTNVGNNYHPNSGTFIAPSAGTYAFDWMIQSTWRGVVYTQLMRNSEVLGEVVADSSHEYEFHSATGWWLFSWVRGTKCSSEPTPRTRLQDTSSVGRGIGPPSAGGKSELMLQRLCQSLRKTNTEDCEQLLKT